MDVKISKTIYIAKAFAVLSIICAHCGGVREGNSFINVVCSDILASLGSIGVGIFLFFSGYLLFYTKKNALEFFSKKISSLILPWAFCGTLVYLYVHVRKGNLGVLSLVKWLLGVDTYLYYMTVLSILYLVCYFVRKSKPILWIMAGASFAWNIIYGILLEVNVDVEIIYLDPVRFALFFTAGLLVANYGAMEKTYILCKKFVFPALVLFFATIITIALCEETVSYFKVYYIFVEAVALAMILGVSAASADKMSALLTNIGKTSFSIYLLHMPIAGIVANFAKRIDFFAVTLVRPFIVLAIVYFSVWAVNKILPKGKVLNLINVLIGMR